MLQSDLLYANSPVPMTPSCQDLADANLVEAIREHARWQSRCEYIEADGVLLRARRYCNGVAVRFLWIAAIAVLSRSALAADRLLLSEGCLGSIDNVCNVVFQGPIVHADISRITSLIQKTQKQAKIIYIDSAGGDVMAALQIGRVFRSAEKLALVVPAGSKCNSSCVFLLAGARSRIVLGTVGIHRPYSTNTGSFTYQETQKRINKLEAEIKTFLHEMNVAEDLYLQMRTVPPENMKILSDEELVRFGLTKVDPVQEEVSDSNKAMEYGLSKVEYLKRKKVVGTKCNALLPDYVAWESCAEEIYRR